MEERCVARRTASDVVRGTGENEMDEAGHANCVASAVTGANKCTVTVTPVTVTPLLARMDPPNLATPIATLGDVVRGTGENETSEASDANRVALAMPVFNLMHFHRTGLNQFSPDLQTTLLMIGTFATANFPTSERLST